MAQNDTASDLAPVFQNDPSGYVAGNMPASRVASTVRNVRRFVDRHEDTDAALTTTWGDASGYDDPHKLCDTMDTSNTRVFLTGTESLASREIAIVVSTGATSVKVLFPERSSLDEDGNDAAYTYETDAAQLIQRMKNDGGWTEVRPFETIQQTVNCPECGAFLGLDHDGHGLPAASCSRLDCQGFLDDGELLEQNAVESVY